MMKKEIGIVGLGKMGANMARHMMEKGWRVVGNNRTPETAEEMRKEGLIPAPTYAAMVAELSAPRVIWLLVPAGAPVEETLFGEGDFADLLSPGDIVIDGGNSFFKDAKPRAEKLKAKGIRFMDVGTSGGPAGARNGACLMVGGERETFTEIEPLFKDFAKEDAYQFFDGHGAGHFVKMVHNGIEYGMMQSIAEGFELLKKSDYALDLERVANVYDNGSVIESRLVGWLKDAYEQYGQDLSDISSTVAHTGEGEWTAQTAKEMGIDVHSIEHAFRFRVDSEKNPRYAGKVVSALRGQFGGHSVK